MYCFFTGIAGFAIVEARTINAFACLRASRSSLRLPARSATRCAPRTPSPAPASAERNAAVNSEFKKALVARSEEHTSELQSLMRISYAVFCLTKKTHKNNQHNRHKMN